MAYRNWYPIIKKYTVYYYVTIDAIYAFSHRSIAMLYYELRNSKRDYENRDCYENLRKALRSDRSELEFPLRKKRGSPKYILQRYLYPEHKFKIFYVRMWQFLVCNILQGRYVKML